MENEVAGIRIPESPMALASAQKIIDAAPRLLFLHSARIYLFSALLGKRRSISVDLDLLFVAAMFHGLGLADVYKNSSERYEVDGANAARAFLQQFGATELDIAQVWNAIALHTTPGIPKHMAPLVALLAVGVEADRLGFHLADITAEQTQQVLSVYPREKDFKVKLIDQLGIAQIHRPDSTFGTVNADILERQYYAFRRTNYCGQILGSAWLE